MGEADSDRLTFIVAGLWLIWSGVLRALRFFRSGVSNRDMVAANNTIMKINNLDQLSYDSTNIKRVRFVVRFISPRILKKSGVIFVGHSYRIS